MMSWLKALWFAITGKQEFEVDVATTATFDLDYQKLVDGPVTPQNQININGITLIDGEEIICDGSALPTGCTLEFAMANDDNAFWVQEVWVAEFKKLEYNQTIGPLTLKTQTGSRNNGSIKIHNSIGNEESTYGCLVVLDSFQGGPEKRKIVIDPRIHNKPVVNEGPYGD